ncbi:hypothetical protein HMPREF9166_0313 [Selenomonas sp. oral taxon 149 str. 67H29BP]|nr:hypothetical protein HMPREF9166_0313 [Selenomonas sp. oral taxon 149 str. 67H29BP]
MLVGIQDEILRLHAKGLLAPFLADKTTKRNIIWATDAYRSLGFPYERTQEIRSALITGEHSDVIKTRARKEMEQQSERTRRHAEVFTPLAVCRQMIGDVDAAYFGGADPFMADGVPSARVSFPRRRKWQHYVAMHGGLRSPAARYPISCTAMMSRRWRAYHSRSGRAFLTVNCASCARIPRMKRNGCGGQCAPIRRRMATSSKGTISS